VDEMIIGGGMAFTFRKELDNMAVSFLWPVGQKWPSVAAAKW
jgi:hypothetical protein